MVTFSPKRKCKLKLNGKRLYETNSVKYLGIRIDRKRNCKGHIDDITIKLIKAIALQSQIMLMLEF